MRRWVRGRDEECFLGVEMWLATGDVDEVRVLLLVVEVVVMVEWACCPCCSVAAILDEERTEAACLLCAPGPPQQPDRCRPRPLPPLRELQKSRLDSP